MAVIGSIRKKSTLLVIVIGVALAAFVLGDFSAGGGASREVNVGVVEGEEITIMDFNRRRSEERRVGKECRSRWWWNEGDRNR